ncbi:MAG: VacJ family lipoprotein [Deltaproteobacteria bacterium]|nr:MAG: VacJ family lipoprotein [Deltaproteobacteria bacterium]RLB06902.1 MAG: VacJ family lipoprotein [Deltaproteobacteria bacterium]
MDYKGKIAVVVFFTVLLTFSMFFWNMPQLPGVSKFCISKAHAEGIDETFPANSDEEQDQIKDPLEPVNRVFFQINDKLYFWLLKPVSKIYKFFVPKPLRKGIRNAFHNIRMPIRFVNNLLQGKPDRAGTVLARFLINSTAGVGGLIDVAKREFDLKPYDEDFGQTLGRYGMGPGFYINWPILGPSSPRDTIGLFGDFLLDPITYLVPDFETDVAVNAGWQVNETSLSLGEYEDLKESAIDPYVAVRNAYYQHRKAQIEE